MPSDRTDLYKKLRPEYDALYELTDQETGFNLTPIFNTLPVKKDYPDYYTVIRNPVSFNTLKKRLPHYTRAQDFINDLAQIPWNAKTYNAKESIIYKYSLILEEHLKNRCYPNLKKEFPELTYPYLGPLPDEPGYAEYQAQLKAKEEEAKRQEREMTKRQRMDTMSGERPNMRKRRTPANNYGGSYEDNNNYEYGDDEDFDGEKKFRANGNNNHYDNNSQSGTPQPGYYKTKLGYVSVGSVKKQAKRGRPPVIELPYMQRIRNVVKYMRKEVDDQGNNLVDEFENIPDKTEDPRYYQLISNPISYDDIKKKLKFRKFKSFDEFDSDMKLMASNYQMFHRASPEAQKRAKLLLNYYTKYRDLELAKPESLYMADAAAKLPVEEVNANGFICKVGDWVLLNNANDPDKPTVGQIFKLWSTKDGKKWLNACWYFRPEQTVHRVDRLFYKNEVMKTGQYRDHPITDIVGKCYVVHFTRYQRGDPDVDYDGPLFVCEFRYNENEKVFNKIRTWKGCIPEEIRDKEERTRPVTGRKFFKYVSPIKHLLPANATPDDPIPEPVENGKNAPPIVGAVYLGRKLHRDDLGEYSTSDDCPRYIIRPNDPPGEGEIDFVTGTMTTPYQTATNLTKWGYSVAPRNETPTLMSAKQPSIETRQNSIEPHSRTINGPRRTIVADILNDRQTHRLQHLVQSDAHRKTSAELGYTTTRKADEATMIASQSKAGTVILDSPGAFVLPVAITKNIESLHATDYGNQSKRLSVEEILSKYRGKGEILWFQSPSVYVQDRLISQDQFESHKLLNRWSRVNTGANLDYEEFEETVNRVKTRHSSTNTVLPLPAEVEIPDQDPQNEIYIKKSTITGLRPSLEFLSHRLTLELSPTDTQH